MAFCESWRSFSFSQRLTAFEGALLVVQPNTAARSGDLIPETLPAKLSKSDGLKSAMNTFETDQSRSAPKRDMITQGDSISVSRRSLEKAERARRLT